MSSFGSLFRAYARGTVWREKLLSLPMSDQKTEAMKPHVKAFPQLQVQKRAVCQGLACSPFTELDGLHSTYLVLVGAHFVAAGTEWLTNSQEQKGDSRSPPPIGNMVRCRTRTTCPILLASPDSVCHPPRLRCRHRMCDAGVSLRVAAGGTPRCARPVAKLARQAFDISEREPRQKQRQKPRQKQRKKQRQGQTPKQRQKQTQSQKQTRTQKQTHSSQSAAY